MPQTYKVLGQSNPTAATLTALYTVPAATSVVGSSIVVANRSATPTSFRISVAVTGAADDVKQYLCFDIPITGNNTYTATLGFTLATTDVVRVYATLATLSFTLFGSEIT
jgi:hypothetical protein